MTFNTNSSERGKVIRRADYVVTKKEVAFFAGNNACFYDMLSCNRLQ